MLRWWRDWAGRVFVPASQQAKQGRSAIDDGKLDASSDQQSCPDNHPSQLGGGEIEIKLLRV